MKSTEKVADTIRELRIWLLLAVVVTGFVLSYFSLSYSPFDTIAAGDYFVEEIIPLAYWILIGLMAISVLLMQFHSDKKGSVPLIIFASILFLIAFRMAFTLIFPDPAIFSPDIFLYRNIVNSWVQSGISFGQPGQYQHDYPLSFLIGYSLVKLGVPISTFFTWAPSAVYAIVFALIYLIYGKMLNKVQAVFALFLFSFSSLNNWITILYCPQIVGSIFFFLSLYFCLEYVEKGLWFNRSLALLVISIILLILTHHLSILYFIVTILGLAVSSKILKGPFAGKALFFLLIGVLTYTLWFLYGVFAYPDFFNFYVYFENFRATPITYALSANLLDIVSFLAYPFVIFATFLIGFLKQFNVTSVRGIPSVVTRFRSRAFQNSKSMVFASGFFLLLFLFLAGFIVPAIFPLRIIELLLIGAYPFSGGVISNWLRNPKSSKKRLAVICLIVFLVIIDIHRYYRQIQRAVILGPQG